MGSCRRRYTSFLLYDVLLVAKKGKDCYLYMLVSLITLLVELGKDACETDVQERQIGSKDVINSRRGLSIERCHAYG